MKNNLLLSILLLVPFSLASNASEVAVDATSNKTQEMTLDQKIALGQEKSVTCAACHGPDGVAMIPGYPSLAAQVPGYIASQLAMYKSGERVNAIMAGQAAGLTEEDMMVLDAYYSSLAPAPVTIFIDENDEAAIAMATEGQKLFKGGDHKFQIASCMSCHGPTAAGIPSQYPRLANQSPAYIESQLLAYKSGTRVNAQMNSIAFKLSEQQIKALAMYIASIQDNRNK